MADTKLTDLPLLDEAPADGDQLYVVDVSDTTDDDAGSSKRVAASRFVRGTTSGFSVLGKSTTGAGAPASIVATANQVLRRSGSGNLVFGTLVTANIGDSQVTLGKIQNIGEFSVLVNQNINSGPPIALGPAQPHQVLRRRGDAINWGPIDATQSVDFGSVINANLADMAQARIKGRAAGAGTGQPQDLTAEQVSAILGPAAIADGSVTNAKLANMATQTIKGRTSAGTGDPQDLTALQAQQVILGMTRQGGNATNWATAGTSTQTMVNARIQCGSVSAFTSVAVTFPIAFSNTPIVFATVGNGGIAAAAIQIVSSTGFTVEHSDSVSRNIFWFAIGPA